MAGVDERYSTVSGFCLHASTVQCTLYISGQETRHVHCTVASAQFYAEIQIILGAVRKSEQVIYRKTY